MHASLRRASASLRTNCCDVGADSHASKVSAAPFSSKSFGKLELMRVPLATKAYILSLSLTVYRASFREVRALAELELAVLSLWASSTCSRLSIVLSMIEAREMIERSAKYSIRVGAPSYLRLCVAFTSCWNAAGSRSLKRKDTIVNTAIVESCVDR